MEDIEGSIALTLRESQRVIAILERDMQELLEAMERVREVQELRTQAKAAFEESYKRLCTLEAEVKTYRMQEKLLEEQLAQAEAREKQLEDKSAARQ